MELIVQFTAIAGFVGGIIGWAIKQGIINPLATAIETLQITIVGLKNLVDKMQQSQHEQDKEMGIMQEQIKVINHRLGDIEEVMRK